MDLNGVTNELTGYDACFYCAGVSSRGMSEAAYSHVTYDLTLNFARTLLSVNPRLVFSHVSGRLEGYPKPILEVKDIKLLASSHFSSAVS